MRKIKARHKKVSRCQPDRKTLQLPTRQPAQNKNAIKPLQPQLVSKNIPQRVNKGWQRLAAQAQHINQIAAELEHAILELKAIADELNYDRTSVDKTQSQSACAYFKATVPCVKRKAGAFVLTTRQVDLFRAEREATQLANTLRSLAKKRKKFVSTSTQRSKRCLLLGINR